MTRKVAHSSWLAVAVAFLGLFGRPAAACTIGSLMFYEGFGGSYTELDYGDYYEGAYYAYVDSTLYFDGNEIADGYAYDYSDAVVTEYDDAGAGSYEVDGDHWVCGYYYDCEEVGQTSATFDDGGGGGCGSGCGGSGYPPTCEVSTYAGFDPTYGYGAAFDADLGFNADYQCNRPMDSTYYPGTVTESITGIGGSCTNPLDGFPIVPVIHNSDHWDVCVDSSYTCDFTDVMGFNTFDVDNVQLSITMGMQGACWIWYGSQDLSYGGSWYWNNDVGIDLYGWDGTGYRGGADGSIYP